MRQGGHEVKFLRVVISPERMAKLMRQSLSHESIVPAISSANHDQGYIQVARI